ncbi:MAG: glycoside hydrolase family 3 C-terminal domain-containing protein [Ktedonobacteraceae bacterium]|nr:glycoside hydrolase family 3 C-terminal domain-containing protein [Ktedonobacteraceae bacterium]
MVNASSLATPDARARAIVAQMTLDEKILEVHGVGGTTPNLRIVPAITRLGIPAFVITNGSAGVSYGTISPRAPATALPAPLALAASWDTGLANSYGTVIGKEAKILGNDMVEGPDMNLARIPQNGRTFENLGEDPLLAGAIAANEIQGIQGQGEIAEAKHYLGNEQELNRQTSNSVIDERTMRELYLTPFEMSVKQGNVDAVMCSYPEVNGQWACDNSVLMNQILKGDWNFQGFVSSDFGAAHNTVDAALGGLDLEMASGKYFGSALKAAVQAGTVPVSVLDDKLIRRFRVTMQLGLWDAPPVAQTAIPAATGSADGVTARKISEASSVLLKNSASLLPLNASNVHSIALIGMNAWAGVAKSGGGGTAGVHPIYTVTPLAGLQKQAPNATITYNDGSNLTSAAAAAKAADVAIVMVGDARKEGTDYPISLSDNQDSIISTVAAANKNTIVVVKSGSVILMPWVNQVSSILEAWYPGEEDGNVVASILFGATNPSGKLPITFPKLVTDLPASTPAQYPGVNLQVNYSEKLDMGYRFYDAHKVAPLFPFGFGLSYTTYKYSNLKITAGSGNTATVAFDITNTGNRSGSEVAEVYVSMPAAAGEPPIQLKGFQKIALGTGATGHASIALDARAFQHWDASKHAWAITAGTYQIQVGASSRNILLQGSITE